jgi:hypothetical protein
MSRNDLIGPGVRDADRVIARKLVELNHCAVAFAIVHEDRVC